MCVRVRSVIFGCILKYGVSKLSKTWSTRTEVQTSVYVRVCVFGNGVWPSLAYHRVLLFSVNVVSLIWFAGWLSLSEEHMLGSGLSRAREEKRSEWMG